MIRTLALEDFAGTPATARRPEPDAADDTDSDEETSLAAFDEGYRCGWEDCAKAEAEAQRRIAADLAGSLGKLTQGYEEARQDVLAALAPLFEEMAARLLPRLAAEAVAPAVIEELRRAAETASTAVPTLRAAPAALPALERLIATQDLPRVELVAEPTFAEGQVSLRFGSERRDIDLQDAANRMAEALRTFIAEGSTAPPLQATEQGAA